MQWDLGPLGLGLLVVMALAFGLLAHVVAASVTTRWLGPVAGVAYLVAGVLVSEVWFGWATGEELQPNIDGLSFDEVLLICTLPGIAALLVARHQGRKRARRRTGEEAVTRAPSGSGRRR